MPDFSLEKALSARHAGPVAGVDEVGRGPLAGPVLAAAVILHDDVPRAVWELVDDSKKLTAVRRQQALAVLQTCAWIGIGAASSREIDRLNVLQASLLAMARAVGRLPRAPVACLVDGNWLPRLDCPAQAVISGDAKCVSIAAASIVAKVTRDRLMARLALRYPHYGWQRNAGYGTSEHRTALGELGTTRHHRNSFAPIREIALAANG